MTRYTSKFVTLQNGIILSTRDGFAPNFINFRFSVYTITIYHHSSLLSTAIIFDI